MSITLLCSSSTLIPGCLPLHLRSPHHSLLVPGLSDNKPQLRPPSTIHSHGYSGPCHHEEQFCLWNLKPQHSVYKPRPPHLPAFTLLSYFTETPRQSLTLQLIRVSQSLEMSFFLFEQEPNIFGSQSFCPSTTFTHQIPNPSNLTFDCCRSGMFMGTGTMMDRVPFSGVLSWQLENAFYSSFCSLNLFFVAIPSHSPVTPYCSYTLPTPLLEDFLPVDSQTSHSPGFSPTH